MGSVKQSLDGDNAENWRYVKLRELKDKLPAAPELTGHVSNNYTSFINNLLTIYLRDLIYNS